MHPVFILAILITLCRIHPVASCTSSEEWITQYQAKYTLAECAEGEVQCMRLTTSFGASTHNAFFTELEYMLAEDLPEPSSLACTLPSDALLEKQLLKIRSTLSKFYTQHTDTKIGSLIKKWSSFCFSKEEKESYSYFNRIQCGNDLLSLTSFEQQASLLLNRRNQMLCILNSYPDRFSSFYVEHGPYLIHLYTHKKMLALLEHDFDPLFFHHVETYLTAESKKAAFMYNDTLLHQFIDGTIQLSSSHELKARQLIKPLLKKLDHFWIETSEIYHFDGVIQEKI